MIDGGPEVSAEPPEDLADIVVGVSFDRQSAQAHYAKTVLKFIRYLGKQNRGRVERKIVAIETKKRKARSLYPCQCRIDLLLLHVVECADPGTRDIQLVAVPAGATFDRLACHSVSPAGRL